MCRRDRQLLSAPGGPEFLASVISRPVRARVQVILGSPTPATELARIRATCGTMREIV